ncbi:hypothetical protein BDK51DRAFT_21948 [Blyttiomyces helicus]|uniref:Outer dynein arm-docking complex subunit 4 n=1 Tax=Blyttiomyces helicus TaxID=388810 RepID=A0A4P9WTH5_9FUNG|nr:hypothetical protein BDK51DRAFT_21948 [Blyttiomyces helicus]|eukprot:RKO94660.1 hypothetical protein BDK51DRAFT_21948 [Blyttiomyces helicus]
MSTLAAGADKAAAAAAPQPSSPGFDGEADPQENLVAKFQAIAAEGDILAQRRAYVSAIEAYTAALAIRPTDKHCLVSRSRCHIHAGSPTLALADANAALKEDPEFFKGIFQKAEALYAQGDFELALMFYHRGNRQRPELDEFRIGIQKAREAIENSIGHPKEFKIRLPGRLGRRAAAAAGEVLVRGHTSERAREAAAGGAGGAGGAGAGADTGVGGPTADSHLIPSLESKLLGELFDDKVYLEGLLSDRDFVEYPDERVLGLVAEGLRYLQGRIDFWRQQNPLYARPKEKRIIPRMERGGMAHYRHGKVAPQLPAELARASKTAKVPAISKASQEQQPQLPERPIIPAISR